jgi:hypothetical protein
MTQTDLKEYEVRVDFRIKRVARSPESAKEYIRLMLSAELGAKHIDIVDIKESDPQPDMSTPDCSCCEHCDRGEAMCMTEECRFVRSEC